MNHREMALLVRDPVRVQRIAHQLLDTSVNFTEKAISFLQQLKKYDGNKLLSERQREFLYMLMSQASRRSNSGGYGAWKLTKCAWEARFDLCDDDAEDWLDQLYSRGEGLALTVPEWRRLLHICRRLKRDLVPEYVDVRWTFGGLTVSS